MPDTDMCGVKDAKKPQFIFFVLGDLFESRVVVVSGLCGLGYVSKLILHHVLLYTSRDL